MLKQHFKRVEVLFFCRCFQVLISLCEYFALRLLAAFRLVERVKNVCALIQLAEIQRVTEVAYAEARHLEIKFP